MNNFLVLIHCTGVTDSVKVTYRHANVSRFLVGERRKVSKLVQTFLNWTVQLNVCMFAFFTLENL